MRKYFQRLSRPLQWFTGCSLALAGAFTLLLLAGVVLWKFENSRESAKSPSCSSNLKQLSLGFLMYVQDYDETWPVGTRNNRNGTLFRKDTPREAEYHAGQGWAGVIYPYVRNDQLFHCPQDTTVAAKGMFPVSYAYNRNLARNVKSVDLSNSGVTVLLAEIESDSANMADVNERNDNNIYSAAGNGLMLAATDATTQLAAAAGVHYATGKLYEYNSTGCTVPPFAASLTKEYRHDNGGNYAMADGHSRFYHPTSVSPGDNAVNIGKSQDCVHGRAAGTQNMGIFAVTFSTK